MSESVIGFIANIAESMTPNGYQYKNLQLRSNGPPVHKISGNIIQINKAGGVQELDIEVKSGKFLKMIRAEDKSKKTYNTGMVSLFTNVRLEKDEHTGRIMITHEILENQNIEQILKERETRFRPQYYEVRDLSPDRKWETGAVREIPVIVKPYQSKIGFLGLNYTAER